MAIPTTEGRPLIPDIAGMTTIIANQLSKCSTNGPHFQCILGNLSKDGISSPTIENVLTHLRGLRAVAGSDSVRSLNAQQLDELDGKICAEIQQLANPGLPTLDTPYHKLAVWVSAAVRDRPVEVFTTNYDLLMEQAFEDSHVPYFDGFAGSRRPFFDLRAMEEDAIAPRWARLWKLHGSINWYQDSAKRVLRGTADEADLKRVIHPSHLKYDESRRMPYLAMIDRLRAFLKEPSAVLIACGYSFRDEHLNEVIVQGLQGNQSATAFVLFFDPLEKYSEGIRLATRRPNLSLLSKDGAVIGGTQSKWTEKDAESVPAEKSLWVTWRPIQAENPNSRHVAEFNLGDFAVFGEFVGKLAGPYSGIFEKLDGN